MATTVALPLTSDGTLTIDELAVLLITSPAHIEPKEGQTVIVTTKDAYLWAVFFSELAGRDGEPEGFLKRVRDYLAEYGHVFRLLYDTLGGDVENAVLIPCSSSLQASMGWKVKFYASELTPLI
jgi:hypothetical protein